MKLFSKLFFTLFAVIILSFPSGVVLAWDLSTGTYSNKSYSFNTQISNGPYTLTFKDDGTKMYLAGKTSGSVAGVFQYSLGTAWDLTTASYDSITLNINTNESLPSGISFTNNGTTMFVGGYAGDAIDKYTLSSAWDISTASYDSVTFSVGTQATNPYGFVFGDSGSKMYVVDTANTRVYQYTLGTSWNISTASYANKNFSIGANVSTPTGVAFNNEGTSMYVSDWGDDYIEQYTLSTPWDVTTASFANKRLNTSGQTSELYSTYIGDNGTKVYVMSANNDRVYQYSLADTTAPVINTLSPADGATSVSATANLVLTFDEIVDVETGNVIIKKTSDDSTIETIDVISGQVTGTGTDVITINPSISLESGTEYYIQIDATAFDDISGNSYTGISDTTSWSFTTDIAPTVEQATPLDTSTDISVSTYLVIDFSEPMDPESFIINTGPCFESCMTYDIFWAEGEEQVTFSPTTDFEPGTTYTISITIDDIGGTPISGGYEWSFTTVSAPTATRRSVSDSFSYCNPSQGITTFCRPPVTTTQPTLINTEDKRMCPADQILNQNLRTPSRNGVFNTYTKGIVTEAKILQARLNQLGFSSGAEDGILGPISDEAIKRMQAFLGTTPDGYVGPITRGLLNNSCGSEGLKKNS